MIAVATSPVSTVRLEHRLVAEMDAVEDADRNRPLTRVELRRISHDVHGSTVPSTATSSALAHRANRPLDSPPARANRVGLLGGEIDCRQERQRVGRGQDPLFVGVVHGERPDGGAAERAAVPAERIGDRAHVRPRGDEQLERRHAVLVAVQHELVDRRRAIRHVDVLARAKALVGALALDLHGGGGGHAQHDLAAERLEPLVELLERRRLVLVVRVAFDVPVEVVEPEIDLRHVALVEADEVLREPRRGAEQHEQEPGRERVERSRMARPSLPCDRGAA